MSSPRSKLDGYWSFRGTGQRVLLYNCNWLTSDQKLLMVETFRIFRIIIVPKVVPTIAKEAVLRAWASDLSLFFVVDEVLFWLWDEVVFRTHCTETIWYPELHVSHFKLLDIILKLVINFLYFFSNYIFIFYYNNWLIL